MIKDLIKMIKLAFSKPSDILAERVNYYMKHPKKYRTTNDLMRYYFGKQYKIHNDTVRN